MQTAVEWLVDVYNTQGHILPAQFEQAKEMFEQQIKDAHRNGFTEGTCFGATTIYKYIPAEQYYNETYKNK